MNYAVQNPEQAIAAAQKNQEFIQATQRENQATGGRIGYSNQTHTQNQTRRKEWYPYGMLGGGL